MTNPLKKTARSARRNRLLRFLARVGFAVNGLLHVLIGAIAISVAVGVGGEADQSGALAALARTPGGVLVLWVVLVGFAALGLWLIVDALLSWTTDLKKHAGRYLAQIGKGVVYLVLAVTTFTFARGSGSSSAQNTKDVSATLLSAPGGPVIVVVVGLIVFAIGVYFVVKGVTKRFVRDIVLPPGRAAGVTVALGVFGYVAKGIVLCVVGVLFWVATATLDPSKETGLDGGLKALAGLPYGGTILVVMGIGLIAYGLYSFVRARYARL